MRRLDVPLQLLVSIIRPLLFTYAVLKLRAQGLNADLLDYIGYLGLFAVADALTQAYARASTMFRKVPAPWLIVALSLCVSVLVMGHAVSRHGPNSAILGIGALYLLHSMLMLRERDLSERACVLITAVTELGLIGLALSLLRFEPKGQIDGIALVLPFSTFVTSRLVGYLVRRAVRRTPESADNLSSDEGSGAKGGAITFITSHVSVQLICSLSASSAVIYNTFYPDQAAYTLSLVVLRWVHTLGALPASVVNVFGSRIFYRSMDVSRFSQAAGMLALHQHWIQRFAVAMPIAIAFSLLARDTHAVGYVALAACTAVVALMNYLSSTLASFGRPVLALTCQIVVFVSSLIAAGMIHRETAPLAALVCLLLFGLQMVTRRVMRAFEDLK